MQVRSILKLALCVAPLLPAAGLAAEAYTSSIPPFSIEGGPNPGFVREIVVELARRTGTELPIVYGKSWPQSQEEAKTRVDTLIFPLARTAAREPHYQWLVKILDMDVAFATAPGQAVAAGEAGAKALARVGVREGAPMVKDLTARGYTNLVVMKTSADLVRALHDGKIDAWYAPAPEIAYNWLLQGLPAAPVFGLKYDTAPLFIAASRNTPGVDLERWRAAYAALEADGTRARILAKYGVK